MDAGDHTAIGRIGVIGGGAGHGINPGTIDKQTIFRNSGTFFRNSGFGHK